MTHDELDVHIRLTSPNLDVRARCQRFPLVILGPSGAGKTTLLESIAGLIEPIDGRVLCNERVLFDARSRINVPAHERRVGYVMQDGALFPHLSVRENVLYGWRRRRHGSARERLARRQAALSLLDELGIAHAAERLPRQISGGERTRTALARALASQPALLLLDEPFVGLDPTTREQAQQLLLDVLRAHPLPMVLVTHDRDEALVLGRSVWVLMRGHVVQHGSPESIVRQPANEEVAAFVGMENLLAGTVTGVTEGVCRVRCGPHALFAEGSWPPGTAVYAAIRPEDIVLTHAATAGTSARNQLPGVVRRLSAQGHLQRVDLDAGVSLRALLTRAAIEELRVEPGRELVASFKATAAHLLRRPMHEA